MQLVVRPIIGAASATNYAVVGIQGARDEGCFTALCLHARHGGAERARLLLAVDRAADPGG